MKNLHLIKRTLLFIPAFLLLVNSNLVASGSFQKIYSTSNGLILNYPFECKDNNGFILGGSISDSLNPFNNNILIVKTDTLGVIQWSNVYGPAGYNSEVIASLSSDGGFLMASQIDSLGTSGTEDILVTKIDSLGNIRWSIGLGGTASESVASVVETQDSGFVVAGISYSFGTGNQDIYMVKLDRNGNKVWSRIIGNNISASIRSIKSTIDGGFILVGLLIPPYDILLVKTNSQGIPEWSRTYGDVMEAWGYDVTQTVDSGYMVLGMTRDGDAGAVIKTDSNGDPEWIKMLSSPNGTVEGTRLQSGSTNNCLIGGHAPVSMSNTDLVLINMDLLGNIIWSITTGTLSSDFGGAFTQVHDGTFIMTGNATGINPGGAYFYKTNNILANTCDLADISITDSLITLAIDSGIVWSSPLDSIWVASTTSNSVSIAETILCLNTNLANLTTPILNIEIYPNPFNKQLNIRFDLGNRSEKKVCIINTLGQIVFNNSTIKEQLTLTTDNWETGIYRCIVLDENGNFSNKSFIKL